MMIVLSSLLCSLLATSPGSHQEEPLLARVEHAYARNGDVRIHYVTLGEGPLVVMLHGFPDYWYTWRHQMEVLAHDHRVVALDLRGYNKSDQPAETQAYAMSHLMADVEAVIRHAGETKATVVGHDWGGAIAWQFAARHPERVERLVVLNVPHPTGLARGLADPEGQGKASQYAYDFQKEGAHRGFTAEGLSGWVRDAAARKHYVEAFRSSSFEAMLAYYKCNYPQPAEANLGTKKGAIATKSFPRLKMPVLLIHGLRDPYLLSDGLNNTWDWIDSDLTLVTIPGAGHFVQHEATERVNRSLLAWLGR